MRTHLLRTFYPSSAIEADTGSAANDDNGDCSGALAAKSPRTLAVVSQVAEQSASGENDDDYLGGYAGI